MLVHTLNALGEDASVWPWYRDPRPGPLSLVNAVRRKPRLLLGAGRRYCNPDLNTPLAEYSDLRPDSIVVYPETTLGNPLGATNIARWLLYKPGVQDPFRFTADEMFFRVGEICDIPEITGGARDLVLWQRNPVYRDLGRKDRQGACYIVRKGSEKARIPETRDAVCIDDMPHEQVAQLFNSCRTFYSYDEATFYSLFAALCGCDSIVIPGMYGSRQEWTSEHEICRYGVAYGLDDIEHARRTRHLVEGQLAEKEAEGVQSVERFVTATQDRFGHG